MFSTKSFSQTNIDLFPKQPASCESGRYKSLNYIISTKTVETAQSLEVSFTTFYGKCLNRKFKLQPLSKYLSLSIFKERINLPWHYRPNYKIELIDKNFAKVTLTLDKDIIFSQSNKRYFSLMIYPTNKEHESFMWIMNARYNRDADETRITFSK